MTRFMLLMIAAAPLLHAHGQDQSPYKIVLDRDYTVGQQLRFEGEATSLRVQERSRGAENVKVEEIRSSIKMMADLEVLELKQSGGIAAARFNVYSFEAMFEDEQLPPLAAGTELTARREGDDTVYTSQGKVLGTRYQELLRMLFRLQGEDAKTEHAYMGTDQPRRVGEEWQIDQQAAAKTLSTDQLKVQPEDISGAVRLEAIEKVYGDEAMIISGQMAVDEVQVDLPRIVALEKAHVEMSFRTAFPLDETLPPRKLEADMKVNVVASGRGILKSLRIESTEERSISRVFRPVPIDKPGGKAAPQEAGGEEKWRVIEES